MKSFCIASPHKNVLWYDYRLYENLKYELQQLGYEYRAAAKNRIYFLGAPQRHFYPEVGKFDASANNLALIYCHSEKLESINQFNKVFVCSEGVRTLLTRKKWLNFEFFKQNKPFTPQAPMEIIRPFSSLQPSTKTKPRYQCDVSFMGTPRIRPILEAVLPLVEKMGLRLNLYGPNWDKYQGHKNAAKYWVARSVPYEEIPMLAKGSKICLIDHHDMMNQIGSVSHKYVDFVMAGGFVICDNNKDAKEYYQGVCMDKPQNLEGLLKTYLADDSLREAQTQRQQKITSSQSTKAAALALAQYFV